MSVAALSCWGQLHRGGAMLVNGIDDAHKTEKIIKMFQVLYITSLCEFVYWKLPPRGVLMTFKHREHWTMAFFPWYLTSYLHQQMRPSASRLEVTSLRYLWAVRSVSRNATKCFTAHRLEETICCLRAWSICCFPFSVSMAGGRRMFFFILSKCCGNGQTGTVQISDVLLSVPSKTNRSALHKIFTTVSSPAFVHTHYYNQHKMKVSLRDFKRKCFTFSWCIAHYMMLWRL